MDYRKTNKTPRKNTNVSKIVTALTSFQVPLLVLGRWRSGILPVSTHCNTGKKYLVMSYLVAVFCCYFRLSSSGNKLGQVLAETEGASQNVGTLGVALSTCTLPGQQPSDRLNGDTIEVKCEGRDARLFYSHGSKWRLGGGT